VEFPGSEIVYTVCKDLGKTYQEIIKMPQPLLMWHYFHAQKHQIEQIKQQNDFQKLLVMLLNPEIYKKLLEYEKAPTFDTKIELDDMDYQQFVQKTKLTMDVLKNGKVVQQTRGRELLHDDIEYTKNIDERLLYKPDLKQ